MISTIENKNDKNEYFQWKDMQAYGCQPGQGSLAWSKDEVKLQLVQRNWEIRLEPDMTLFCIQMCE